MEKKIDTQIVIFKNYNGRVPACGVFCGGCPMYVKTKNPCKGAEINKARCEKCKTFHLCCQDRGINHCFECSTFPCYKFRKFSNSWLKYGQNFIDNQRILKERGDEGFLYYYNLKVENLEDNIK